MLTFLAWALNSILTLQSEEDDGVIARCASIREVSVHDGSPEPEAPLNLRWSTYSYRNAALTGITRTSRNFQVQTQLLALHFSYIYRPTHKTGVTAQQ